MRPRVTFASAIFAAGLALSTLLPGAANPPLVAAVEPTPAATTISGRITGADGTTGLAGARVVICSADDWRFCMFVAELTTGSDGRYETGALDDGAYHVQAVPPASAADEVLEGWYRQDAATHYTGYARTASAVVVAGASVTGIDIALQPGHRISGHVTVPNSSTMANGATIDIYICNPPDTKTCSPSASANADPSGDFTTSSLPSATYWLYFAPSTVEPGLSIFGGWYSTSATNHYSAGADGASPITLAGSDVTGIDLTLSRGYTISGRVTAAATGLPVAGAEVSVCELGGEPWLCSWPTADSSGDYTTSPLPDATYQVSAGPPAADPADLLRASRPDVVIAGANVTGGDVALPSGLAIRGRVVAASDGTGVSGARVVFCTTTDLSDCDSALTTFTAANGDYTSGVLPGAGYQIFVWPPDPNPADLVGAWYAGDETGHAVTDRSSATLVTLGGTDQTVGTIALPRGHRISGRFADLTGNTYSGVSMRVTTCPFGGPCDQSVWTRWTTQDLWIPAGGDGSFRTGPLPDGAYRIEVRYEVDFVHVTSAFYTAVMPNHLTTMPALMSWITLAGADVTGIEMSLPRAHDISGRILAAGTAAPVSGATVVACVPHENLFCAGPSAPTASDGTFTIPAVSEGTYNIRITPPAANPLGVLPGWYSETAPTHYTMYESEATHVNLTARFTFTMALAVGHRISGRITDGSTGTPIAGVSVNVNNCSPGDSYCVSLRATVPRQSTVSTNTNGDYVSGLLPDDSYQLEISSPDGYAPYALGGWYTTANPYHFTTDGSTASRVALAGADVPGIDIAFPPLPCTSCEPTGGTTSTTGWAWGGGFQVLAGGRATFGFAVRGVAWSAGDRVSVSGHLTWHQPGSWRFTGSLDSYVRTGTSATATGTGTLWWWRAKGTGRAGTWTRATTDVTRVTVLLSNADPGKGSRGTFGITFSGKRAAGVPALPAVPQEPLGGGSIRIE